MKEYRTIQQYLCPSSSSLSLLCTDRVFHEGIQHGLAFGIHVAKFGVTVPNLRRGINNVILKQKGILVR